MRIQLEPRYALLAVAYLLTIYWLSSLPDLSTRKSEPLLRLAMNLGHVPLFAGLAVCVLKSLASVGGVWWGRHALAFPVTAACAALDEWRQSFVPGRDASIWDLLLDLAGIGGTLLLICLRTVHKERRRAAEIAQLDRATFTRRSPTAVTSAGHIDIRRPLVAGCEPRIARAGNRR